MNGRLKRLLAVALSLVLTLAGVPAPGYAESGRGGSEPVYIPVEAQTENGTLDVYVRQGENWSLAGQVGFTKWFDSQTLSLNTLDLPGETIELKLVKQAVGLAHIDGVFVNDQAPIEAENGNRITKDKVSLVDNDVIEVDDAGLTFVFETDARPLEVVINARIEPEHIAEVPFAFPESNENGVINMASDFYTYTWNDNSRVGVLSDGLSETEGLEPLFKAFTLPGSGHPSGYTYGWVMNDENYLYAAVDFTPDNTVDGDKDYTALHVRTPSGVKVFTVSQSETMWGQSFFTYTDNVNYEHKVYKFKIPKSELEMDVNDGLRLAFSAYGTAAPDYLYDLDIAFSPVTNQYMLSYVMTDNESIMHLYMQLLDYRGTPVGDAVILSDVAYGSVAVSMAYNALQDAFLIVYQDAIADAQSEMSFRDLKGIIIDSQGDVIKSSFDVMDQRDYRYNPVVAYNSDHDSYYVTWETLNNGSYVEGVEITADSTSDVFIINTAVESHDTAYNPVSGLLEVVYEYQSFGSSAIYYAEVASGGSIELQDVQISSSVNAVYGPSVVYDATQATFFTVWTDNTSGSAIVAQYDVTSDSAVTISSIPTEDTNYYSYSEADLASRGDLGEFLSVWKESDYRSEIYESNIIAAFIDSTGHLVDSVFDLNDDTGLQSDPRIAYNSNNDTFLVVYEYDVDGVSSIGAQLLGDPTNGTIGFASSNISVEEGESVTLTLDRLDGIDGETLIAYETVTGTAISTDFTLDSGTLTFKDGDTSKSIVLQTTEDKVEEGHETFTVVLELTSGDAVLGTSEVTVTIMDDDIAGTLDFDQFAYETQEGTSVDLTVVRSGGSDGLITVDVATADSTANSTDYTSKSGSLEFADGESSKTITIDTTADTSPELDETFTVTLSSPTGGATLGEVDTAVVTILDDDAAGKLQIYSPGPNIEEGQDAVFTVYRTDGTAGEVAVDYTTSTGTATSGADFTPASGTVTFAAGQTEKTITVSTTDDNASEATEYFTVTISNATGGASLGSVKSSMGTIYDNDLSGTLQLGTPSPSVTEGENAVFTVYRSGGSAGTVTVSYATSDNTATAGLDYTSTSGTLTFEDGVTEQTVTVPTLDDTAYESTELFMLTLTSPSGGASLGEFTSASAAITDNDEYEEPVYGEINFSASSYSVVEGNDISINVTLDMEGYENARSSYIDFFFEITNNTTSEADIAIDDETYYYDEQGGYYITYFDEGATSMTIKIPTVDDSTIEGSETFTITMMDPYGAELGSQYSALVTIVDNDRRSSSGSGGSSSSSSTESEDTTTDPPDTSASVIVTVTTEDEPLSDEKIAQDNTTANEIVQTSTELAEKLADTTTTVEEADAQIQQLQERLDTIEDEAALSAALDSYIGTVDALGNAATQEEKTEWVNTKLSEMNASVSKAIQKLDNDANVVEVAQKLVNAMDSIQAEGKVEKSAEIKKAVENLAQGALNKLGKLKTTAVVQTVGEVSQIAFDDTGLEEQVAEKVNNYNTLKQTFNDYYGAQNVRDFELQVTLATEKVSDKVQVKVDTKILDTLDRAGVDTVGIQVGGTKLLLDKAIYAPSSATDDAGTEIIQRPDVAVDMDFSNQSFEQEDEKVKFKKGYTTDVNVTLNGEKKEVLTKPVRLSFELNEFEFWNEDAGPSSLSVFRMNTSSGEWEPVGGEYDPVTNTLSTRRISLSQYTVMQSNKTFNDVESSWAKDEINELLNKGIVDDEVAFNPEETITREEFTTWVARAYGLTNDSAEAPFTDINLEDAHYTEVASAYSAGIVSGSGENFNPDEAITKEQMSAILANAMTNYDDKMLSEGVQAELAQATDQDLISDWAGDDMALLLELGVLDIENGNLDPQGTMTKEQAAAYLKKIYG